MQFAGTIKQTVADQADSVDLTHRVPETVPRGLKLRWGEL